jgi:hypothetical protein
MAKLKAQGQSSGSGVYTLKTGTSNSNFDLTLPDVTGTLVAGYSSSTGDVAITGNLVISTSGKGIDFSATAGTGTSEVLDDYEEGTWTPSISGGTMTVTVNNATYTKIGDMVTVWCHVGGGNNGNSTHLGLAGLPFTNSSGGGNNYAVGTPIDYNTSNAVRGNTHMRVGPSSSIAYGYYDQSSHLLQQDVDFGHFIFSITYKAT